VKERKRNSNFPLVRSLRFIFLSILLCTGVPALIWISYQNHLKGLGNDSTYNIRAIVQTGPEKEALSSVFFAEYLNLSIDKPSNLVNFNLKEAERKLRSLPFMRTVNLKKIHPETLYIDYTVKKNLAKLVDFTNTVIDFEGGIFPLVPYFSPKNLPNIYLGLFEERDKEHEVDPLQHLQLKQITLILDLLENVNKRGIEVSYIDLSQAFEKSLGKREIVIEVEDSDTSEEGGKILKESYPKVLRLSTVNYIQNLDDFLLMQDLLKQEAKNHHDNPNRLNHSLIVVDLRIKDLAFLSFPKRPFLQGERRPL
jgi:hypothetical protein